MCFSAEADFVGAAVVGAIGVATLAEAHDRRDLALAALPLGFALHQAVEGVVWLGLEGHASRTATHFALYAYLAYAWVLLPVLVPVAVWLAEPRATRRRWLGMLTVAGAVVACYLGASMATNHLTATIAGHTIKYGGAGAHADTFTVLYVIATCGAFLMSSHRRIMWFGVANLAAVFVLVWVQAEGLTSLWCVWGALASVLVYRHFADRSRADVVVPTEQLRARGS